MKSRNLVLLLALLLAAALGRVQADNAYLRPARAFSGDIVELVIEYENRIPSLYALDTSALEADFEVLKVDSSVSRVNDGERAFHRMQSIVKLLPRRSGTLTVPALVFGDRRSPELELEVLPLTAEMRARDQVLVELEAAPLAPYVGQQVVLKLRLLNNVAIARGSLVEPELGAARRFRHDDLRHYRIERGGQAFDVREQTISLFPTQPGTRQLTPAAYRGRMLAAPAQAPATDAAPGRLIERRSGAPLLKVRAPPTAYGGAHWLPAMQVELARDLSGAVESPVAGDVLDLELGITAVGLPAESLPANLYAFDGEDLKIYADEASRSNRFDGGKLVGQLQQRYAVVVARPGKIELPGLVLTWWDVEAEHEREARLEPRVIEVGGDAAAPRADAAGAGFASLGASSWPWLLAPFAAGLAMILLAYGLRRRLRARVRAWRARRATRRDLARACSNDDAAAARACLLRWGRARWPGERVNGLLQLALLAGDAPLRAQLELLDAHLYAARGPAWRGAALWRAIVNSKAGGRRAAVPDSLPRLYPASSADASSSSDQPAAGSKRSPNFAA